MVVNEHAACGDNSFHRFIVFIFECGFKCSPGGGGKVLLRGKGSIGAVSGAEGVGGYNSKMISCVRTQARDVRKDILVIVPSFGLVGRSVSVAGGSSILKVHGGAQSVGINGAVEFG